MAKVTTLNHEATAKGTKMFTQAELAVAQALNTLRKESGSINTVIAEPTDKWKGESTHVGSGFFTTDQMADNYMGERYVKTESRPYKFDTMNKEKDIDLVLASVYKVSKQYAVRGAGCSISVKKMDRAVGSSMINIELRTFNPKTKAERDGWIKSGKSDYTAIALGTMFLIVKTSELKELVEVRGYAYKVFPHLTAERVEENEAQGRTYTDSENMLVPLSDVKNLASAKVVNMPDWYATKWKSKANVELKEADAKRRGEWEV